MIQIQKKVCLLGDFAVGKTSLVRRFVEGRFDDKYLSTIGVKASRKTLVRKDHILNLLIWDLAGGDDFTSRDTSYLLGAAGALIVCDLTRQETLNAFSYYTDQLLASNPNVALVFTGNKVDLVSEQAITIQDMLQVSHLLNAPFVFTSAKTGEKVEEAFELLATQLEAKSQL